MSTTTNTVTDLSTLTEEQLHIFVAEARRRKMEKAKGEKFAKYEPTYTDYRNSVVAAKKANDLKKSLLSDLKKLGWGAKVPKTTTPKTGATYVAPVTTGKGSAKKK